jgi:hypothetical protein
MKAINMNIIKSAVFLMLTVWSFNAHAQHDLYGLWSKRAVFGNGGSASISLSTVDEEGNVYVAGRFTGTLNPVMRTAVTNGSLFLIKYGKDGKYVWDVVFSPTIAPHTGSSIRSLHYSNGKVLLGGSFGHTNTVSVPMYANAVGVGTGNSKTITSHSPADGSASSQYQNAFLQVVNRETGKLQATVSTETTLSDAITICI